MIEPRINQGITIGTRRTLSAPDGSTVLTFGVQLVEQGVALGVNVRNKDGQQQEYIATVDARALGYLLTKATSYLAGMVPTMRMPRDSRAPAAAPTLDADAERYVEPAIVDQNTRCKCAHFPYSHSYFTGPCGATGCECLEYRPAQ